MRLCIVTHNVVKGDGQGRVNYEVAWEAIRRGHHVTLLASRVDGELAQNNQVYWVAIPVQGWPLELLRNMVFAQRSAAWLRQNSAAIDLVLANGAITSANSDVNAVHFVHSSWLKFSSQATPSAVKSRSNVSKYLYNWYQWFYTVSNARWEKRAFRQAQVVVAVSDKVAKELQAIGVPPELIRVIVNGVDVEEFSPGSCDRSTLGLPTDTLALFVGDIRIPRKNLETVLQAMVMVPQLHLAVVGAIEGSPYPQLAATLGLSDRTHFLGFRSDVPQIMRSADFLVFPSRYEPFGLVITEAMATGIPVITAAATGAAALVTPEAGIVLSDSDDTEGMARALEKLTLNPDIRIKMGQAGRAIALQQCMKKMAQQYVDLFEELKS